MKIVIACSKNWFNLDKDIFRNDEVVFIKEKGINIRDIRGISPKFVFFPHLNWFVWSYEIIVNMIANNIYGSYTAHVAIRCVSTSCVHTKSDFGDN